VEWSFNSSATTPSDVLACSPTHGTVAANSKQVITLRASAGVPDKIDVTAQFDVAHFEPVTVHASIQGTCGMLATSLPRVPDEHWPEAMAQAASTLQARQPRLQATSAKRKSGLLSRPGVGLFLTYHCMQPFCSSKLLIALGISAK
jgi:hypothetical protein